MNACVTVTVRDLVYLVVCYELGKLIAVFVKALLGPSVKVIIKELRR